MPQGFNRGLDKLGTSIFSCKMYLRLKTFAIKDNSDTKSTWIHSISFCAHRFTRVLFFVLTDWRQQTWARHVESNEDSVKAAILTFENTLEKCSFFPIEKYILNIF